MARVRVTTSLNISLDVSAAYPNNGAVYNISKNTTSRELISIQGVDEFTQRMMGINLVSAGHVNAVEVCVNLFKTPSMFEWLDSFQEHLNLQDNTIDA